MQAASAGQPFLKKNPCDFAFSSPLFDSVVQYLRDSLSEGSGRGCHV
jgi:hypothetical protein